MDLMIYDSLTGEKRKFVSIEANKIGMYACGITVSDNAHIGHAFQAVIFDIIKKYFEYIGYEVKYVRNYTDVDDKIIAAANKIGMDPKVYAEKYIKKADEELLKLGCDTPTIVPKATEHITDIILFIEELIKKGYAYEANGDVYFDVLKYDKYGKLSNNTIENMLHGVRKENFESKRSEIDFALWKSAKEGEISWESPWGFGRPGWHIECSAMSKKYLGETFDIHGGGRDLKFPHHENEIAQSCSVSGKPLANYWIHNGLIKVNGVKMSKSLGNGILLEDLLKEYYKDAIRLTFIKNSYRTDINIVDGIFNESEKQIYNFALLFNKIEKEYAKLENKEIIEYPNIITDFIKNMNNDFNTPNVISDILNYYNELNKLVLSNKINEAYKMMQSILNITKVLGLFTENNEVIIKVITDKYLKINAITEAEIMDLIKERNEYKLNKNYEEADRIRDYLKDKGISINDTREGSTFILKL